jgi:hypothetical protein
MPRKHNNTTDYLIILAVLILTATAVHIAEWLVPYGS